MLKFDTISIHLILGHPLEKTSNLHSQSNIADDEPMKRRPPRLSSSDRIPGFPLLSPASKVVGSLHPDNLELSACKPGSKLECLILSRSQLPVVGSALLHYTTISTAATDSSLPPTTRHTGVVSQENQVSEGKAWDLFWVLHVVWKNGVAERRGLGQVLTLALENSCSPLPAIKSVLLG